MLPRKNYHHSIPISFLFASLLFYPAFSADSNTTTNSTSTTPYVPRDLILLNCGASGQSNDSDGRVWTGDTGSKFATSLTSPGSTAPFQDSSVPQIPYMTARMFSSPFTYSFPLGSGRKFVRLHFYASNYSSRASSDGVFSVTAGDTTLLSNFSVYQTSDALNYAYLVREFSVNVTTSSLDLTFTPSPDHPNSYAFVNGIEIVSTPDLFGSSTPYLVMGGTPTMFPVDPNTSLQTMYRLNVGGKAVSPPGDSGLYRSWEDDSPYIFGAGFGVTYSNDPNVTIKYPTTLPNYIAPVDVYSTARSMGPNYNVNINSNLTWILSVDAGFTYLVRFHFCEIQYPMTKINMRVFDIFINNQTAQSQADVIAWSGGIGVPTYQDYVIITTGSGWVDMWIALHPDATSKPQYYDAILNGLEVFKLQNGNSSLAGLNPVPVKVPNGDKSTTKGGSSKISAGAIAGVVVGALVLLVLAYFCLVRVFRRRGIVPGKDSASSEGHSGWLPLSLYGNSHSGGPVKTQTTGSYTSSLPSNLCRHFSFAEIRAATKNFDESLLLGVGGFGKVYRGEIDNGTTKVAIKRGNPLSEQGVHEFQTEIEMLSKLRHRHLVSLIGYCEEKNEMILVYDYMAHGTLREHLYKTQNPPLPWKQRLEICIGAARGLHYLHTGAKHTIIHRDVKTTNILLDEKWVAKVSDFGLSKTGPSMDHTHVSTVVKGSFGYLDPEYFRRQQLTDKSDVYSFGVVLFEVLCARPALNPALAKEEVSLAEWAVHCQKKGILDQIVDPYLQGKIAPQCLKKFAETAEKCVADAGVDRPSMGDVLWNLEFALSLQETAEGDGSLVSGTSDEAMPLMMPGKKDPNNDLSMETSTTTTTTNTSISIGGRSVASEDSDGLTPSAVFSQIMNPKGR
ncbi:Malectin/receptor-like protein kinase family protein [Rhynchospora pubera]|uniref:non-specific serine/threonine protein kinase n=1 Tax=Rhynchospora pubera TaxID=906938 RepID=A0AAV8HGK2_9POAL|nr:Malectin/receptor-like protein kinase family protein [Rhynchospora pubera]